jgi:hypothetical protein
MKTIITVMLILYALAGFQINLRAQNSISYKYDASVNRTKRLIVHVESMSNSKTKVDTTSEKEGKKEILEQSDGTKKIRIYPNPTNGKLTIEILGYGNESDIKLNLYKLNGGVLFSNSMINGRNALDISDYPAGVYILKINIGDMVSEWKIVKE